MLYSLEYGMMVRVLHQLSFSGEFHAEVSSQTMLKGGGKAVLRVQNGNVASCLLFNKDGMKLYHDRDAQRVLSSLGILDWRLSTSKNVDEANSSSPSSITIKKPEKKGEHLIPRRLNVSEPQMRTWSTQERSVYFLVDGTRSIEQIAVLLSRPPALIEQIMRHLVATGAITRL